MATKVNLNNFSLKQLRQIRTKVQSVETKEELLETLEKAISKKEKEEEIALTSSLNARFPIDWMNIDPTYKTLLHKNGIENLAQLRAVDDLKTIEGITPSAEIQLMWAREFFNMDAFDKNKSQTRQYAKGKRNTK